MEKRNKFAILFSFALIPIIFGILFVDLAGTFSYSDVPFVLAFVIYILFVIIQRSSSRGTFIMTLYLLILMGLSYVKTGPGAITERFGEWFYLFFVFGLIQYAKEAWTNKTP